MVRNTAGPVIPLGGYVKMFDGRVDDLSEDEQQ